MGEECASERMVVSVIAGLRQLENHAALNTRTRLDLPHAPRTSFPRAPYSPRCSSNYRDRDCRKCNLATGPSALGCRRVVEGVRFQCHFGNFNRVWHVENVANFGCEVGMGSSCNMVRIWLPDEAR